MPRRSPIAALLCSLLLLGCSHAAPPHKPQATPPVVAPAPPVPQQEAPKQDVPKPEVPAAPPVTFVTERQIPLAIVGYGNDDVSAATLARTEMPTEVAAALASDESTYSPAPGTVNQSAHLTRLPEPTQPEPDAGKTMRAIAAYLEQGGDAAAFQSPAVTYLATMAAGVHAFNLGPPPDARHAVGPYHRIFQMQRQDQGWQATQICTAWSEVAELWAQPGHLPVLVCSAPLGQGKLFLYATFYRGTAGILAAEHLEAVEPDALAVIEPPAGTPDGPPDIQLVRSADFFGYGRTSDYLHERLTLTWRDGGYQIARREWQADWAYHAMHFLALVGSDADRAAKDLAFEPAGGLAEYLRVHAPGLEEHASHWAWPRRNKDGHGFHVCGMTPGVCNWYWFDFEPDGRIAAIGTQKEPPKE